MRSQKLKGLGCGKPNPGKENLAMYLQGITDSATAVACAEQQRLLNAERFLRAAAMSESDTYVAAVIANAGLILQRRRHAHLGACPKCLLIDRRAAA